jgi:hypothetical protein
LTLQVSPSPNQPRGKALELRELDLHLAFRAARALREDIEDETGAVDHRTVETFLEIALLHRGQIVVEDGDRSACVGDRLRDLVDFAFAGEKRRIRTLAASFDDRERADTCTRRELLRFF